MAPHQALPSRITLADALEFSCTLAKHNPFVRMTLEEQELANQAGPLLSRMANTEELLDVTARMRLLGVSNER